MTCCSSKPEPCSPVAGRFPAVSEGAPLHVDEQVELDCWLPGTDPLLFLHDQPSPCCTPRLVLTGKPGDGPTADPPQDLLPQVLLPPAALGPRSDWLTGCKIDSQPRFVLEENAMQWNRIAQLCVPAVARVTWPRLMDGVSTARERRHVLDTFVTDQENSGCFVRGPIEALWATECQDLDTLLTASDCPSAALRWILFGLLRLVPAAPLTFAAQSRRESISRRLSVAVAESAGPAVAAPRIGSGNSSEDDEEEEDSILSQFLLPDGSWSNEFPLVFDHVETALSPECTDLQLVNDVLAEADDDGFEHAAVIALRNKQQALTARRDGKKVKAAVLTGQLDAFHTVDEDAIVPAR